MQVSLVAELARAYFELRGGAGAPGGGTPQRGQPAQYAGRHPAAARRWSRHRIRYRAGPGAAQLHLVFDSVGRGGSGGGAIPDRGADGAVTRVGGHRAGGQCRPAGVPEMAAVNNPDSLVIARPDVAAADRRAPAERSLVGAAKADYLPRFSIGASAGFSATSFDSLGKNGTFRYAVGPGVTWPLFNLGRVKARVDASRAQRRRGGSPVQSDRAPGPRGPGECPGAVPVGAGAGDPDSTKPRNRAAGRRSWPGSGSPRA